ncbi:MAG TPA: post-COAP-1 domain-containing protein, partial [Candidatus Nitrosotalea sp.]|nr:post-COAP-1 domain-containing protein [Candidatus Nitrosotalea sp.]
PTVTNNAPSGGFPVGTTTVTWTATDHSGNKATALQTVTIIPKNTIGKITGGGQIQKDVNFGFETNSPDGVHFTGDLEFNDKLQKINLHSKSITGLFVDINGKQGTFDGTATVNEKSGYTFHVYVEDNGEPGTYDVFKIQIFDSHGVQIYSNGGTIISGNIQIHKSDQDSENDHNTGHGDDNHGNTGHGDDNHGNSHS